MHTAIEPSAQTKAVKLKPLVYRVEEIAQLLAISPRDAPKVNIEERTIWDEKTMLAALQTIENPALHLAVHMSMILSLREGEILGLQPSDLDFDAADGRGTIAVNKTMQRKAGCANHAQKSPRFGQMCKRCAESVQPLSYTKKERQILRFDVQYLVHLQGLEPWAH